MNAGEKAKAIVYIDVVFFIISMLLMGVFSIIFAFQYNPQQRDSDHTKLLFISLIVRCIIAGTFQLVTIILLLEGVLLKNYNRCFIWLVSTRILLALMFLSSIIKIFLDPISIFIEIFAIIYKIFSLRIVNEYAVELHTDSVFHP